MQKEVEEQCCGACCWFKYEDTTGWGLCCLQDYPIGDSMHCSNLCTQDAFVSEKQKRHYMAILVQHNRWRKDNNVPNSRKMVDVAELGKAIDFSIKYMHTI